MSFEPNPFAPVKKEKRKPNRWASCIGVQMKKGNTMKQAAKICGTRIKRRKK